jgi:hypothetical protein
MPIASPAGPTRVRLGSCRSLSGSRHPACRCAGPATCRWATRPVGHRMLASEGAVTGGSWLVVGFVVAGIVVVLGLVDLAAERRGAGDSGREPR